MQVSFETCNNILIIKLTGELDHHSCNYTRDEIDNKIIAKNPKNIIFDMSNLNFMDSSGIGVIIGRYKLIASNGGKVGITSMKPPIKRIYEICGLKRIIPSFENKKAAIEKL
ncbi:MAG: anti-sigma F factor antagonist [Lutispora sp.]|nr:anti-sigma F factor antagonist [Lutispora sp.]MDD4833873.1 anti-sigma F factor antagonist [Lutispora sp.]